MPTIEESAAALRAKHMPPHVRPFTGSPTTMARGVEALAVPRSAPVAVNVKPAPAGKTGPGAPAPVVAQPWKSHPSTQGLPADRRVFRSIDPIAGHVSIRVQAGKTPMRAAKAALGDAIANGIDGYPVRVLQSTSAGVTLMSRSDDHAAGKDPVTPAGGAAIVPGGDVPQAPVAPKVA